MKASQSEQPHQAAYAPVKEKDPISFEGVQMNQVTFKSQQGHIYGIKYDKKTALYSPYLLDEPNAPIFGIGVYGSVEAMIRGLLAYKVLRVFIKDKEI